jgi:hypothetical protein
MYGVENPMCLTVLVTMHVLRLEADTVVHFRFLHPLAFHRTRFDDKKRHTLFAFTHMSLVQHKACKSASG